MNSTQMKTQRSKPQFKSKPLKWNKIFEIAFWGTVIWTLLRLTAFYFSFTPYGVRAFSRLLVGIQGEDSVDGTILGLLVMGSLSFAVTLVYALIFSRIRVWWGGLVYGAVLLGAFGYFYRFDEWKLDTWCTEAAWFLTYGLFVGMSLTAERFDES